MPLLFLLLAVLHGFAHAAEPAAGEKPQPLISAPSGAGAAARQGRDIAAFFCSLRFARGTQSNVILDINFARRTVNDNPALITPLEIRWTRVDSRGRSFNYTLNRYSGLLEGGTVRNPNQVTGRCDRIGG